MPKPVERWRTHDGKEFETRREAEAHEMWLRIVKHYEIREAAGPQSGQVYKAFVALFKRYDIVEHVEAIAPQGDAA